MLRRFGWIIVCALFALFLAALGRIVSLRLGSGEIYPEYSSLRADPRGTKAFYESLARLGGKEVRRHLQPIERLRSGERATVLFLGTRGFEIALQNSEKLETLAREGARVVVAVNALASISAEREQDRVNRPSFRRDEGRTGRRDDAAPVDRDYPEITLIDPLRALADPMHAFRVSDEAGLPESIPWYGRYSFDRFTNEWETVYEVKSKPVILERRVGLGSIVLCADSFLFSNEALARERWPEFLLWTVGPGREVVFDESHLGVHHGTSIMLLLREFRLQGLFFGFLIVAALWIWKSSVSFVPSNTEGAGPEIVQGKTAREGVVHLLERNIPADRLPEICLAEWRKSYPNLNPFDAARYNEAERLLEEYRQRPRKERDPVQMHRELTTILSK